MLSDRVVRSFQSAVKVLWGGQPKACVMIRCGCGCVTFCMEVAMAARADIDTCNTTLAWLVADQKRIHNDPLGNSRGGTLGT